MDSDEELFPTYQTHVCALANRSCKLEAVALSDHEGSEELYHAGTLSTLVHNVAPQDAVAGMSRYSRIPQPKTD